MEDLNLYLKNCLLNKTPIQTDLLNAVAYGKISGNEKTDTKSGDEHAIKFYGMLNTESPELLEVIGVAANVALRFKQNNAAIILFGEGGYYPLIHKHHQKGDAVKIAKEAINPAGVKKDLKVALV
ncbi:MAG: hypothetical protein PHE24_04415 [Patescibacteria group bacterium]|nr:hypothetical protein [Patescibacteria group bacterium]